MKKAFTHIFWIINRNYYLVHENQERVIKKQGKREFLPARQDRPLGSMSTARSVSNEGTNHKGRHWKYIPKQGI